VEFLGPVYADSYVFHAVLKEKVREFREENTIGRKGDGEAVACGMANQVWQCLVQKRLASDEMNHRLFPPPASGDLIQCVCHKIGI
jgi:hypothetical protein